MPRSDI